jgi:hypothetical protein
MPITAKVVRARRIIANLLKDAVSYHLLAGGHGGAGIVGGGVGWRCVEGASFQFCIPSSQRFKIRNCRFQSESLLHILHVMPIAGALGDVGAEFAESFGGARMAGLRHRVKIIQSCHCVTIDADKVVVQCAFIWNLGFASYPIRRPTLGLSGG